MHHGAYPRSISNLPLLRSTVAPKRPIAHSPKSPPSTCRHYRQIPEEEYRRRLAEARPLLSNRRAKTLETIGTTKQHRTFILLCVAAAVVFYFANSQKVPVTGRRRFNFLSEDWLTIFGVSGDAYEQELRREGVRFAPKYDWRYARVMGVMQRLVPVSGQADKDWKVHVILDDGAANAFVTPDGHVFVFSGIINLCGNIDSLATVLGHEIAHNVATHSAERLSAAIIANLTSGSLFLLLGLLPGLTLAGLWTLTGGRYVQSLIYDLPMNRKQETEADYIGLMMMAEACYDPRHSIGFWERMKVVQSQSRGYEVPEMLSTHPSDGSRIEKLTQWLPEAMEKWQASDCHGGQGAIARQFRDALSHRRFMGVAWYIAVPGDWRLSIP
ncbi:putative Zn-dependent protease [Emericellopsis cladophorae]|uniref:Zn-dependent protease n=1 Tax=Emericellopsis cladophorae TaxID=2686198 RepID=A0A9P9Y4S5_9HYPO|nr:putative Zn-dependent protease [Emericellopsis cladophorae]KAI6783534.1 putative Zn-dependent protease [Emericellopsis cladophorae]